MRENNLLSLYRVDQGTVKPNDGRITTDRPNDMWGVDGVKVQTVLDGWVRVFWSIEHWNAECLGWHVAKKGDRFAALEPLTMAVEKNYGSVTEGVAKGLKVRPDLGSQYRSASFSPTLTRQP